MFRKYPLIVFCKLLYTLPYILEHYEIESIQKLLFLLSEQLEKRFTNISTSDLTEVEKMKSDGFLPSIDIVIARTNKLRKYDLRNKI